MKRVFVAVLAAAVLCGPAEAARHDRYPLHPGSSGKNVAALQWLLSGKRPNVYREIKGTFHGKPNGYYGNGTLKALTQYRFRLGYPARGQCGAKANTWQSPEVTGYFVNMLEGKARRPACWVALAASRLKAIVAAQPTAKAVAWRKLLISWLGISEYPDGSNRGPCISYSCSRGGHTFAIQASTGAYGAAWCVSTQQAAAAMVGYGHFAQDTAGVYYAADYYAARNLTYAKPKVGSLVAFITYDSRGYRVPGTGHMGFVVAVQANSFTYIAGNDGNAVREHTIPDGSRPYVFIRLPGVA